MRAVASALPESTTIDSSANETDARQSPMLCASFFVMMITLSFGNEIFLYRVLPTSVRPPMATDGLQWRGV